MSDSRSLQIIISRGRYNLTKISKRHLLLTMLADSGNYKTNKTDSRLLKDRARSLVAICVAIVLAIVRTSRARNHVFVFRAEKSRLRFKKKEISFSITSGERERERERS